MRPAGAAFAPGLAAEADAGFAGPCDEEGPAGGFFDAGAACAATGARTRRAARNRWVRRRGTVPRRHHIPRRWAKFAPTVCRPHAIVAITTRTARTAAATARRHPSDRRNRRRDPTRPWRWRSAARALRSWWRRRPFPSRATRSRRSTSPRRAATRRALGCLAEVLEQEPHADAPYRIVERVVAGLRDPRGVDLRVDRHAAVGEVRRAHREEHVVDDHELRVDVDEGPPASCRRDRAPRRRRCRARVRFSCAAATTSASTSACGAPIVSSSLSFSGFCGSTRTTSSFGRAASFMRETSASRTHCDVRYCVSM